MHIISYLILHIHGYFVFSLVLPRKWRLSSPIQHIVFRFPFACLRFFPSCAAIMMSPSASVYRWDSGWDIDWDKFSCKKTQHRQQCKTMNGSKSAREPREGHSQLCVAVIFSPFLLFCPPSVPVPLWLQRVMTHLTRRVKRHYNGRSTRQHTHQSRREIQGRDISSCVFRRFFPLLLLHVLHWLPFTVLATTVCDVDTRGAIIKCLKSANEWVFCRSRLTSRPHWVKI